MSEDETWIEMKSIGRIRTRKEAINLLKQIQSEQQGQQAGEGDHRKADAILCSLLNELGFGSVVKEFAKIEKWYA